MKSSNVLDKNLFVLNKIHYRKAQEHNSSFVYQTAGAWADNSWENETCAQPVFNGNHLESTSKSPRNLFQAATYCMADIYTHYC